jgi:hypothetical protein
MADFSAGYLSSDGGMLFLRQIDEGLGISRSLAGCFYDARHPLFIEHSVRELVAFYAWLYRLEALFVWQLAEKIFEHACCPTLVAESETTSR